jgi:hypothetical protein
MAITLDGTTGITTPGLTNTGTETLVNLTSTGDTTLGDATTDTLTVGVTGIVKDASGNVGIGTASPAFGGFGSNTGGIQITNTNNAALKLNGNAGGDFYFVSGSSQHWLYATGAVPMSFATNGSERMRIDSSGNVGIGLATTGDTLLEVYGANSAIVYKNVNTGTGSSDGFYVGMAKSSGTDGYVYNRESANVIFGTANAERARIDSSGKLLVGTTSLLSSDDIGGIYWSSATGGGGVGGFEFRNTSTSTNSDINPALVIIKGSTTYTSSQRFIQFNANAGSQAMGGIVGNGATNAQFISLSDARDKDNIQTITGSLNKITALNPVEFDWKQTGEHINAGFIAQEVELVFPEYVVDNVANAGQEERKGLTGGMSAGFVAHLVKAIQEQQALILSLTTRLTALENK